VNTEFDVLRIYFPLQPKCQYLTQKTKDHFLSVVPRESTNHKLVGLVQNIPSFIEEMEHLEVMSHHTIQITPDRLNNLKDLSTLLAFGVGGILVSTYEYKYLEQPDKSYDYKADISEVITDVIFGMGAVQAVTSFLLVVGFLVNKSNLIVRKGWRDRIGENQITMMLEKRQLQELRD
jgi:hypothetical protein